MKFEWNDEKNQVLLKERGIGFSHIQTSLEQGDFLMIEHTNAVDYPHQKMFCVFFDNYAYAIPAVETDDGYFLKTIIPSRRLTKKYLRRP